MDENSGVVEWHEKLLAPALKWREQDPDFRFSLRTTDVIGKNRLSCGYWFPGTDRYLFFAPFRVNDPNNKTKTIGFVIEFDRGGRGTVDGRDEPREDESELDEWVEEEHGCSGKRLIHRLHR